MPLEHAGELRMSLRSSVEYLKMRHRDYVYISWRSKAFRFSTNQKANRIFFSHYTSYKSITPFQHAASTCSVCHCWIIKKNILIESQCHGKTLGETKSI